MYFHKCQKDLEIEQSIKKSNKKKNWSDELKSKMTNTKSILEIEYTTQ